MVQGTGSAAAMGSVPGHTTDGTGRREPHQLAGQGLTFNLQQEIQALRGDLPKASGGRTAKTLVKSYNLRVTLVLAQGGITIKPNSGAGDASVQVVEGRLRFPLPAQGGERREIGPGDLVLLSENLEDPFEALEDTAFLVTVAWEDGQGAADEEGRTGHLI